MANNVEITVTASNKASPVFKTVVSDAEGMAKKVSTIAGGVFGGNMLTRAFDAFKGGITSSLRLQSDFNESQNKAREVFGAAIDEVERFGRAAPNAIGLSERAAFEATSTFGNMFDQLSIGTRDSSQMSQAMVQLAADLASFHNADITQVIQAQTSAFRGEYDALQRYIPAINAAMVEQQAMQMTGKENAKSLTMQEKALATYQLILQGAGKAQGDFGRTSDGTANAQRRLKSTVEEVLRVVGAEFEPTWNRALNSVLKKVQDPGFQEGVRNWAKAFRDFGGDVVDGFDRDIKPAFEWIVANEGRITGAIVAIGLAFAWVNPVAAGLAGITLLLANAGKNAGKPGFFERMDTELRNRRDFQGLTQPDPFGLLPAQNPFNIQPGTFGQGTFNPATGMFGLIPPQAIKPPGADKPTVPMPDPGPVKAATDKLVNVFKEVGETFKNAMSKVDEAINGIFNRPTREQLELKRRMADIDDFKARFGERAVHFGPGEGPGTMNRAKLEKEAETIDRRHERMKLELQLADQTLKTEADLNREYARALTIIPEFTGNMKTLSDAIGQSPLDDLVSASSRVTSAMVGANSLEDAVFRAANALRRLDDPNADTLSRSGTTNRQGEQTGIGLLLGRP